MLSDKEMYDRMKKGWRRGSFDGTVCGQSSTLVNTRVISKWLPDVCQRFDIHSVCDAGAGDLHWIKNLLWDVEYKAFDLIPRSNDVKWVDITTEALPECDAILCRMVLNHLDEGRTEMAINLFRESATYLIATHFVGGPEKNYRAFTRLDLCSYLGEPLEMSRDGHEDNCMLALWEL